MVGCYAQAITLLKNNNFIRKFTLIDTNVKTLSTTNCVNKKIFNNFTALIVKYGIILREVST